MTELRWLSAVEAARAIRERDVSPVELAVQLLGAIAELNRAIGAFTAVMPERVLAEAKRAEQAVANGELLGPLHGVPFAVKDMLSVAGYPITHGSHLLGDASGDRDAVSVARLKAAGGIVLGITAMAEFGHKGFNDSPRYGVTRNPWDRTRTAGGSSGGTAAALAAGLTPAGLGTDVGGSIRIPAACCGIVGLKPTLGAVPYDDGVDAFAGMMHVGPMARTVRRCSAAAVCHCRSTSL